ncbi:uncharacterized protein LAESUDRAFT_642015 [Laetiporus sulphureus 93-53]|uniref:JmjC domain-containing protein n=1 Tax=Laetiporus sulphureus 93-53 TaxID=1314785 RepID=A0A165H7E3_9APHY|nr:uncharacterized protein LAESUDRAFT_642015 [Laetiporus sulphureus 93-53]KZT11347.1 hypothetical protein LAESUDRAFT_642015 [Laetiporus sulphureus 93-53]
MDSASHRIELDPESALIVNSSITAKGWKLERLLQKGKNFVNIRRVSMEHPEMVRKAIDEHEREGVPLVIQDWHKHAQWAKQIFDADWLLEKYGNNRVSVRNCHDRNDKYMSLREFITTSRAMDPFTRSEESERLYAKDAECPEEWRSWLQTSKVLPDDLLPQGTDDLLQYLPQEEAVESLMCYYGIGDTLTPCHKDLCGSSGHNIMCYVEKGGSSFWFMTASNVAPDVAQYFQKEFGEELDWETHVTTVEEFANAPFNVYVTEQRLGDLVLVPPRSCHQVVNHGGLTMKMSWSRMTFKGLRTALHYELPIYRRVCRPEQYRVKAVLYHSLLHYTAEPQPSPSTSIATSISSRMKSLKCLLDLFDELLCEEFVSKRGRQINVLGENRPGLRARPPSLPQNDKGQKIEQSRNVACDFCGADIFQSFFECQSCLSQGAEKPDRYGDGLLICAPCYVEGRSCRCGVMTPVQCRPFVELLQDRNNAANALKQLIEGESRSIATIVAELTER